MDRKNYLIKKFGNEKKTIEVYTPIVNKFKEKILQTAKDIIEQEIREQHPADIYKSAFEGENSIDNLLKRKIKESLEEKFKLIGKKSGRRPENSQPTNQK